MPYKTPLIAKGKREPRYWHFIKLCWFMVHFEDIFDEISIKEFCERFSELVVKRGIIEKIEVEFNLTWEWFDENEKPKAPDYDTLMSGHNESKVKHYEWHTQYPTFKTDRLQSIENSEREKFIRNIPNLTKSCHTTIDHCAKREEKFDEIERGTNKGMDYLRNKNTDTKKNEVEIWMKIIGLDENKKDPQETTPGIQPIIENPPWENKEELAEKRKILWGIMPKRGEK